MGAASPPAAPMLALLCLGRDWRDIINESRSNGSFAALPKTVLPSCCRDPFWGSTDIDATRRSLYTSGACGGRYMGRDSMEGRELSRYVLFVAREASSWGPFAAKGIMRRRRRGRHLADRVGNRITAGRCNDNDGGPELAARFKQRVRPHGVLAVRVHQPGAGRYAVISINYSFD